LFIEDLSAKVNFNSINLGKLAKTSN